MDIHNSCSKIVSTEKYKQLLDLGNRVAENFNIKLDYSNNSIKKIEEMLSTFHKEYAKTKNDEGLNGIAIEFAAYIVETINKNSDVKGKWFEDHAEFGEKTFPFLWKDTLIFSLSWCQKRIFDGASDNVWSKYQSLVLSHIDNKEENKKGFWGLFKK